MVDAGLTLILELLRRQQDDLRDLKDGQRELLRRVGAVEQHMATMLGSIRRLDLQDLP